MEISSILQRIVFKSVDECWDWTGSFSRGRPSTEKTTATREIWELWAGTELPSNVEIHHTCENITCVNPHHFLTLSGVGHRQLHGQMKTECKYGHPFTPENTGYHHGRRTCKKCNRDRERIRKQRIKEQKED